MKNLNDEALPLALELGCVVALMLGDTEVARGRGECTSPTKEVDLRLHRTKVGDVVSVGYEALTPDGEAFLELM